MLPFQLEDTWSQLKAIGSVPDDLAVLPPAGNWHEMMGMLQSLAEGEHSYTSLVIDTIGCAEIFCHERVCHEQLKGKWGEDGFAGYQRGYEMALPSWRELLNALDRLRDERKMRIILLGHTKIAPYKNPTGPDYDRIVPDVHHKTWSMTHKWADAVLYCNFFVAVSEEKGKRNKARGGDDRVIYTEYDAAYDAKNRYGMPPEIPMGNSGKEAWDNIVAAIQAGRKQAQPAA